MMARISFFCHSTSRTSNWFIFIYNVIFTPFLPLKCALLLFHLVSVLLFLSLFLPWHNRGRRETRQLEYCKLWFQWNFYFKEGLPSYPCWKVRLAHVKFRVFWSFKLAQFEGIWRTFTLLLNLLAALFQILWLFPSISFSNASKTDVDLFPFFICHYHYHCHCRCTFIVSHAETIVLRAINDSYRVKETSASSDGFMVIVSTK